MPLVQALGVMAIIFIAGILSTLLYNRILVRVEQGVLKLSGRRYVGPPAGIAYQVL